MSALVNKIRHGFSDLSLEIELFFSKFKGKKHVPPAPSKAEGNQTEGKTPLGVHEAETTPEKEKAVPAPPIKSAAESGGAKVGTVVKEEKVKPLKKMPLSLKLLRLSSKERLFLYDQMAIGV